MQSKRKLTILLKPYNNCNMNCSYCFDKHNFSNPKLLEIDRITKFISKVGAEFESVEIILHGGEILTAPYNYVEQLMFEIFKVTVESGCWLNFAVQTNGTLLDDKFLKLFSRYGAILSTSYDITDEERGYVLSDDTLKNFSGSIVVLTKNNIDRLSEIYNKHKELNVNVKFNFPFSTENIDSYNLLGDIDYAIDKYEEYIYNDYLYDVNGLNDEGVNSLIGVALNFNSRSLACINSNCASAYMISVLNNGDIYKCDNNTNAELKLGNIDNYDSYASLNDKLIELNKMQERVFDECYSCDFFPVCNRGCLSCRLSESNNEKYYSFYCRLIKRLCPNLFSKLSNLTPTEFIALNNNVKQFLISNFYVPRFIYEQASKQFNDKFCYATLAINESDIDNVLMLNKNLLNVNSIYKLIVLATDGVINTGRLSEIDTLRIDKDTFDNGDLSINKFKISILKDKYDKCFYVDNTCKIADNIDFVFNFSLPNNVIGKMTFTMANGIPQARCKYFLTSPADFNVDLNRYRHNICAEDVVEDILISDDLYVSELPDLSLYIK